MEFASRRTSVLAVVAGLLVGATVGWAGCRRRATSPKSPLAATFALRGRVVDTAGRAIPDARVLALPRSDGGIRAPRETTSNGEGRFAFDHLPGGRYALVIEAAGLLPATPPPVEVPGGEALVRLAGTGRTLTGLVVAAGAPAAGARVRLGGEGVGPARATRSDESGRFTFHGLGAGRYTLRAARDALVSPATEGVASEEGQPATEVRDVRLELAPGLALAGSVVDDRRLPLPGVEVEAAATADDPLPETTRTGADGKFQLPPLAPGPRQLVARAPGYVLRDPVTVVLASGKPAPTPRLELARGASIAGRVVDARGAPLRDAQVRCLGAGTDDLVVLYEPLPPAAEAAALGGGGGGRGLGGSKAARTDARGGFVLEGLYPGRVHLEVTRAPAVPLRTEDWTLAPGQRRDVGLLTLSDGLVLQGRVVDQGGAPVGGAHVTVSPAAGLFAQTDAAGTFQLALAPGTYVVTATVQGGGASAGAASATVRLTAGAPPPPLLTLALAGADGSIEGVAFDSGRRPLARARVRAFALDPTRAAAPAKGAPEAPPVGSALTDAGGHFALGHVPRRPLTVEIDHPSYPRTWATATPGTHLEVTVPIPGGIEGEVRERATGALIPRARVAAVGPEGETQETAADKRSGAFRLARLRPGRWTLTVIAPGYHAAPREVEVQASPILGDASVRGLRLEVDAAGATPP